MAKELITVSDKNGRVFGFADQAVFSKDCGVVELFVSFYCYDSSAYLLRPTLETRTDEDNGITLRFNK